MLEWNLPIARVAVMSLVWVIQRWSNTVSRRLDPYSTPCQVRVFLSTLVHDGFPVLSWFKRCKIIRYNCHGLHYVKSIHGFFLIVVHVPYFPVSAHFQKWAWFTNIGCRVSSCIVYPVQRCNDLFFWHPDFHQGFSTDNRGSTENNDPGFSAQCQEISSIHHLSASRESNSVNRALETLWNFIRRALYIRFGPVIPTKHLHVADRLDGIRRQSCHQISSCLWLIWCRQT